MPREIAQRRRTPRAQRSTKRQPLYAAVDLGTNNCRLLIARRQGDGFAVVDSYSQIARLGEGLAASGALSDAAMERGVGALKAIRRKLSHHGVGKVRCIATEACRRASNGAAFIRRVREETGLTFKIIDPREEAELAAIGCHDLLDPASNLFMVLDIGGGSTEISFIDLDGVPDRSLKALIGRVPVKAWSSFPLGVVTLSESYAHLGEEAGFAAMVEAARTAMSGWADGLAFAPAMANGSAHLIGTSGTVTCLAGVHCNLPKYRRDIVDGIWMSPDEARAVITRLREAGPEGRREIPTIGPERAGLMLSGCAILEAAWSLWPSQRLRVADRGLREGLLLSMIHGVRSSPPKRTRSPRKRGRRPGRRPDAGGAGV